MTHLDYDWEPGRTPLNVSDFRLQATFTRTPGRYATVSEYAQATGISTDRIVELIADHLDTGALSLEFYGDEVFIHTAPFGRPAPDGVASTAPNLWERLRRRNSVAASYAYWKLIRSLETVGWHVETDTHVVHAGLGRVDTPAVIGITVGPRVVPVLAYPAASQLSNRDGLLTSYDRAGAAVVAVTCDEGRLDEFSSATRRWMLDRRWTPRLAVMILEAPRYQPVLHTPDDGAVQPISIARASELFDR